MKKIKRFRHVNNVIIFLMLSSWLVVFLLYCKSMHNIYTSDFDSTYYIISTMIFSALGAMVFGLTVLAVWINRLVHGWKKK